MEGFITFILIFFLIIWLLVRFAPYLLKWWIQKKIKNYGNGFGGTNFYTNYNNSNTQNNSDNYREGEVYIKNGPKEEKIVDKGVGEYVDYEETK